jgi:hypothetical protein
VSPPTLAAVTGSSQFSPFFEAAVLPSEPLPLEAAVVLAGSDGAEIPLLPDVNSGAVPVVTSFHGPGVVLPFGKSYALSPVRLVDFAGNSGADGAPIRLGDLPTPPLIAADGFQSVPDGHLGGAAVVTTGSLASIAAARSLYIGPASAPGTDEYQQTTSLTVRLALAPGDRWVRVSSREVAGVGTVNFLGSIQVGAVGGRATTKPLPTSLDMPAGLVGGKQVFLGDVKTTQVPLPDGATGEVVVMIASDSTNPAGLLIDDLRVE